jgi:hypothetical protein
LNSKLLNFIYQNISQEKGRTFAEVKKVYLSKLPIKIVDDNVQFSLIEKADKMLELNQQLQDKKNKFLNRVRDNFEPEKSTKKLDAFYDFEFKDFVSELKKQNIKLSLLQQDEWEDYFTAYKSEINKLQSEIAATDKAIDQMVYELYGLTEDEIKIVEEA